MKFFNRFFSLQKILLIALFLFVFVIVIYNELVFYGLSQGYGQAKILLGAKPVEIYLKDTAYPDSLKNKILLVQEIRKYAFDSLGLNYSENYTTMYNQNGKPVLWIVTACEPYALKAKEWTFPIVGTVSYKGFFKLEKAKTEAALLQKQGYDISIDEVGGWSTLGWFKDPLLSSMLERSEGSLSNLIIHELTHGTLFIKDNVDFNENLASFVGNVGTSKFLRHKYGDESEELKKYEKNRIYSKKYTKMVLSFSLKLDSVYKSFKVSDSPQYKKESKQRMLQSFRQQVNDFISTSGYKVSRRKAKVEEINNTYFMDIKRYRENLDLFEKEFQNNFKSDFQLYMKFLKNKYPSV